MTQLNMNGNIYYLFERDLTSKHVSYHFCFKEWDHFKSCGKIKESQDQILNIFEEKDLIYVLNDSKFHKAITPQNNFIEDSYFHITLYGADDTTYEDINQKFHIKTNYKYNYFTKKIKELDKSTNFKCGFTIDEFKKISHDLKNESYDITRLFKKEFSNVIYAFDFSKCGNIIHDNINIEIIPRYSKLSFFQCVDIIKNNFSNVNSNFFEKYISLFDNYNPTKFHFHLKIKLYKDQEPVIKFYRSYGSLNPYIN